MAQHLASNTVSMHQLNLMTGCWIWHTVKLECLCLDMKIFSGEMGDGLKGVKSGSSKGTGRDEWMFLMIVSVPHTSYYKYYTFLKLKLLVS